jgi:ubiquinone/menaquinone biosynthesis C-methylase UbiE
MLLGSLVDLDKAEEAESVLGTMARAIKPGKTALLAEATEPANEVVDSEMERLGGKVVRRSVAEVEAEIAAAGEAAWAAEEEARRKPREQRSAELKEKVQQKIDELKARLGAS